MISGFRYKGFEANDQLITEAEDVLDHIENHAPQESTIIALLEYAGGIYSCSIDLFFKRGSVYTSVSDSDAFEALRRVEETVRKKLDKTKETQFYKRKPEVLTNRDEAKSTGVY